MRIIIYLMHNILNLRDSTLMFIVKTSI